MSAPLTPALTPMPFDEPWQAEIFALTVHLNERGLFAWTDWATQFGAGLAASPTPVEGGDDYYTIWLNTLMQMLIDLGHTSQDDVDAMVSQWRETYEQTPHGQTVRLTDD